MSYRICKTYTFSASHQLNGLPPEHQCGRLHGHNYTVWLEMTGDELPENGMLHDFGDLGPFKAHIDNNLDHQHLNDQLEQPTAENLALHLWAVGRKVIGEHVARVVVWETATCWASYGE